MKITLDTNILVRGNQNASGPSRSLLNLIAGGEHILVLSPNLLYELEEVLRYPQIRRLTRLTEGQIAEYVGFLSEVPSWWISVRRFLFPRRTPTTEPCFEPPSTAMWMCCARWMSISGAMISQPSTSMTDVELLRLLRQASGLTRDTPIPSVGEQGKLRPIQCHGRDSVRRREPECLAPFVAADVAAEGRDYLSRPPPSLSLSRQVEFYRQFFRHLDDVWRGFSACYRYSELWLIISLAPHSHVNLRSLRCCLRVRR